MDAISFAFTRYKQWKGLAYGTNQQFQTPRNILIFFQLNSTDSASLVSC